MGTVQVTSAARVQAIADASLVSGEVDESGHLVLTKGSGTTIDVGSVASAPNASTTVKGIVELATDAETSAGTDSVRAVTPFSLAALLSASYKKRRQADLTITANDANGYVESVTVQDDGTASTTWVERLMYKFKEVGGLVRNVFYLNEYGEVRVSPARHNTTALRVFVKEFANNPVEARSTTVPVMEVMDNRTTRTSLWGIVGDGTMVVGGNRMAYVLVLSAAAAVPAGTPAGTVIVRTTT